jgi:hypothetical protein
MFLDKAGSTMPTEIIPADQRFTCAFPTAWSWFRPAYEVAIPPPIGQPVKPPPAPISNFAIMMGLAGQGVTGTAIRLNDWLAFTDTPAGLVFTSGNPIFVATAGGYGTPEPIGIPQQPVILVSQIMPTEQEAYSDTGWNGINNADQTITSYSISLMVNGYDASGTEFPGQSFLWWCVNSVAYPIVFE